MNNDLCQQLATELAELKQQGLYRLPRVIASPQEARVVIDGRQYINLCSNNYLGLTTHPKMVRAMIEATERYGVGSGAVRTIAGTMEIHVKLEEALAAFKHTPAALLFQSGFTCNMGVIGPLLGEQDVVISDELNHASIIDGIRLSRADRKVYPHNDMDALEKVLRECGRYRRRLIVTDGVFSMDGDIAPLPDIVSLAQRYNAITMVDDAHASGVLGRNGRGTVDHFGLHGKVDVQVGTLSKAIGVLGGYVACSRELYELMVHRSRPFLFSTSHPPGVAAANLAALEVMQSEPELFERLWDNTRFFKGGLEKLGFNTGNSATPITPVIVGQGALAMRFSDSLLEEGLFVTGIGYPTVPENKSRVRTIVTAAHTKEDLAQALDIFARVGKRLGII